MLDVERCDAGKGQEPSGPSICILWRDLARCFSCDEGQSGGEVGAGFEPLRKWHLFLNDLFLVPSSRSLFGFHRVNDALYPSKSGLINKHTVKHTILG